MLVPALAITRLPSAVMALNSSAVSARKPCWLVRGDEATGDADGGALARDHDAGWGQGGQALEGRDGLDAGVDGDIGAVIGGAERGLPRVGDLDGLERVRVDDERAQPTLRPRKPWPVLRMTRRMAEFRRQSPGILELEVRRFPSTCAPPPQASQDITTTESPVACRQEP